MQSGFSFVLLELCYSCSVAVVFYWCGCFCVVFFSTKPFLDGKIVPKVTSFVLSETEILDSVSVSDISHLLALLM